MIWIACPDFSGMERAAKNNNNIDFQVWQQHSNPVELSSPKIAWQKLEYLPVRQAGIHQNPVKTGIVDKPED
jgi:hypothetical protein